MEISKSSGWTGWGLLWAINALYLLRVLANFYSVANKINLIFKMRKGGAGYMSVGSMGDPGRALNWQVEWSKSWDRKEREIAL